jgi:hypothetical protein
VTPVAYADVACAALPGLSVHGPPAAGAVAVFIALFVSPVFVVRMPPKKTRSEPSGMRRRSGCAIPDQPPRATESEPTLPAGLTSTWMRSSFVPFLRT